MKVITEQYIRDLLKHDKIREFHVEHGLILSPAAKDYMNQERVRVFFDPPAERAGAGVDAGAGGTGAGAGGAGAGAGGAGTGNGIAGNSGAGSTRAVKDIEGNSGTGAIGGTGKFVDSETGAGYDEKPDYMTQLSGNKLVNKDHARIVFRGELDHLQSQIVLAQALLNGKCQDALLLDLEDALALVRTLLRAEVLDELVGGVRLFGLDGEELRDHSHHSQKHYGVKAMTLPHYSMGESYALLNLLRSQTRQAEVAAARAFRGAGRTVTRPDMMYALNRLSSAFHVLCCRILSGYYNKNNGGGGANNGSSGGGK